MKTMSNWDMEQSKFIRRRSHRSADADDQSVGSCFIISFTICGGLIVLPTYLSRPPIFKRFDRKGASDCRLHVRAAIEVQVHIIDQFRRQ